MKNIIPYRYLGLLCVAMIAVSLSCCIKDDGSQCDPWESGKLSVMLIDPYESDDPQSGLNTDEFPCISLFVYDRHGHLVSTIELNECLLYEEYALNVVLPQGEYDLVAWAGSESFFYNFENTTRIDLASLNLYIPEDHEIDYWISHLYFGETTFTVSDRDITVVIPMIQYTNDINYTVIGLERDRQYSLDIEDDNGKYSFRNTYLPCVKFGYNSGVILYNSDWFRSKVTILRLSDGRNPVLTVIDELTGDIIYPSYEGQETNLVALIKSVYRDRIYDFDARHTFELSFVFDTDMIATVYIDKWEVKNSDYEI